MYITLCLDSNASTAEKYPKYLGKLLGRANKTEQWATKERGYANLLGMVFKQNLPIAALNAAAWEVMGPHNHWIHADPVNIMTDQHNAFLMAQVTLDDNEITALLLDINQLLFADDCTLYAPQMQQWLLNLAHPPEIKTTPLAEMMGSQIAEKLPVGEQQVYWHRLFTELQMLLHTHPVNQKRRAENKLTVDALWFWGEGEVPASAPSHWSLIASENSFVNSLAYLSDLPSMPLPDNFTVLTENLYSGAEALIILPDIRTLSEIEEKWAKPLWDALKNHSVEKLRLVIGKQCYDINAKTMKRWWRKSLPI